MTKQELIYNDEGITTLPEATSETRVPAHSKVAKKGIGSLLVNVVDQPTAFLLLRTEWNTLVEESPVHVFQTFDWQWFWWKHFSEGLQLHIITFRDNEKLVGIIPLFLQTTKVFGIPVRHTMRMIGCGIGSKKNYGLPAEYGPSDYLDVIVCPGYEMNVALRFSDFLLQQTVNCHEVRFENVPHESIFYRYFLSAFEAEHLNISITRNEFAPYISTPASMDDFTSHLSPGMRHHIRQSTKQFKHHPPFFIESITSETMLHCTFLDMVNLHQLRWNSLGYAGLFSDSRFLNFQKDIAQKFFDDGILWLKAVRMGGIHTAVRMGFMFKGKIYDYLSGFDETLPEGKKRPSLALLVEMVEDAIVSKCSIIDLLRGTEQYKKKLTSSVSQNSDILLTGFYNGSPVVYALYVLARIVRKIVRRVADESALFLVQLKIKGFPKCLISYPGFVLTRIRQKLS